MPPPVFLRKGANFIQISADCTRLRINYTKAVRTADDGIKITCPDVETFRIIRGIPADFPVEEIKADLCDQGFPVLSVHRLYRRDGTPLWLVFAVLPRTEEAKNLSRTLNKVCGLSGIRVDASHKKGGPGQCHRNCPLTRDSEEKPSCVNCGITHTANNRGCPKAPKFSIKTRPNTKRPFHAPAPPSRDLENFSALASKKTTPVVNFHPRAPPTTGGRNQPLRVVQEPPRESARRAPPGATLRNHDRRPLIAWRRYPNGDGCSPCGFELGDLRVRGTALSVSQRRGEASRSNKIPSPNGTLIIDLNVYTRV
ncbi:hypothetical protein EVAR_2673_1 [Eumeta japonica]|uniref:Pre-C2HC domain-containing protein n=1 Tax=Eumeta variegata TaxID=151549 RepID=A0A4C1SPK2_EUMVA|nr:hypothetical protein EVAR_2673_1 [Eumeta japonica]